MIYLLSFGRTSSGIFQGYKREAVIPPNTIQEPKFRYDIYIDPANTIHLLWDIDPATDRITFKLDTQFKKHDLVGFGFSDYGESTDADVVIFWTDTRGKHHFQVRISLFITSVYDYIVWLAYNDDGIMICKGYIYIYRGLNVCGNDRIKRYNNI